MKKDAFSEDIALRFPEDVIHIIPLHAGRVDLIVRPERIINIAEYLYKNLEFRFIIASALHSKAGIEIYYHFSHDPSGFIYNLHVTLDPQKTDIESLTPLFSGANWIEREMHEILGIQFLHHPGLDKLISEGNWAEGVYPYRKDQ